MSVSRKIRPLLAISALAVALGFGALAAAPAQAQTNTRLTAAIGHTAAAAPGTAAATAHVTFNVNIVCDYIDTRGTDIGLCSTGTYYDGGNPYRWPVTYVWNYASNRVWFHQNQDGSGWSKCFTGGYIGSVPAAYQHPGNIFISTNTAPC
jgi:hypothetical protein